MSTRSYIKIKRKDGTVTSIYCHWDGYIEHNGVILQMYYDTPEKVEELLKLGDLSSLGYYINPKGHHSFERPEEDVCVAYHRDRGEEYRQSNAKDEFNYIYDEEERCWFVEIEKFIHDTDGQKTLHIDCYTDYETKLLIDAIIENSRSIDNTWYKEEPDVINKCVEKAVNARADIIKEQIERYNAYYDAYCM